jgi:nucleotide-binding universal stress UspA family protein
MSMQPIVVGTDGSQTAERAVDKAAEIAEAFGVQIHVVTSCRPPGSLWMAAAGGVALADAAAEEDARRRAEEILDRARHRLGKRGIEARTHVCHGEPAEALVTIAQAERAQMMVVGNRGMNGARRVLGSVPNRVSHSAPCSVLIVSTS